MKKILVKYKNGYGLLWKKEFNDAEEYLEWIRKESDLFNKRNEEHLELVSITTIWLPLDWRGLL